MAGGSHAGPILQALPTHMGLWDKWVLGRANPSHRAGRPQAHGGRRPDLPHTQGHWGRGADQPLGQGGG